MRLLDLKGKVWSALVGLVVIAAITLLGLMMVPKQGKKMGFSPCFAMKGIECKCPEGYNNYDSSHPQGACKNYYGDTKIECQTLKGCWKYTPPGVIFKGKWSGPIDCDGIPY